LNFKNWAFFLGITFTINSIYLGFRSDNAAELSEKLGFGFAAIQTLQGATFCYMLAIIFKLKEDLSDLYRRD
jgi:hypothetical protein